MRAKLPPGQRESASFPRFGIPRFARRFPRQLSSPALEIRGEVDHELCLENALQDLPRVEQVSDLHCVTTWSRRGLRWGGVRFAELWHGVIVPRARPRAGADLLRLRGQDGAWTGLLLEDALAPDVLLADTLGGEPLGIAHGAPLRLVAPAHYAYKSVKHLGRIELAHQRDGYRVSAFRFMDHPRARIALEERGRVLPGWFLRYLYRPLIRPTAAVFARAMAERETTRARD